jgi:hypothetical protein
MAVPGRVMRGCDYERYAVRLETTKCAPLHSLKLTQRRTHPAVIYSTPAGERQRPRVRRSHERRLGVEPRAPQQGVSRCKTRFQILESQRYGSRFVVVRHAFVIVTSATGLEVFDGSHIQSWPMPPAALLAPTGERRKNFNLYGLAQLLLKIFLVSHPSINQYRTQLDDGVEMRIRSLEGGDLESLSDRLGIDYFLGYARCGPCASPVMKGNGHHCVSLRHALRPFRGG